MTSLDDLLAGGWRETVAFSTYEFKYFIQGMDSLLVGAAAQEKAWLDSATEEMDSVQRGEFLTHHADTLQKLTDEFPTLLWNSVTVMVFAYWEREYRDVAEWLLKVFHMRRGVTHSGPLKVRDFQGSWYEQARKAVTKYAGVPDDADMWARLTSLARIRNVIAHDSGRVGMHQEQGRVVVADERLRAAIGQWAADGVSVSDAGELRTSRQLVEAALALVRDYMMNLLANCERHLAGPRGA